MAGSYKRGVEFIALNDEPEDEDPESVQYYVSTLTLAATFDKAADVVAKDVVKYRRDNPSVIVVDI